MADVDDDVVADHGFGYQRERDAFADAAEVDQALVVAQALDQQGGDG